MGRRVIVLLVYYGNITFADRLVVA